MTHQNFLPARLQPRHDGWTPQRQWRFIEVLAMSGSVTEAARAVTMAPRSAHRLRQHPDAAAFRAAWDAALDQAWGQLEQVALDRAINGEREVIERDGLVYAERTKPCSDRLLIHLLTTRERHRTAARAERMAEHKRATAEAKFAALTAGAAPRGRKRGAASPGSVSLLVPVPLPCLESDADANTTALRTLRDHGCGFDEWGEMAETAVPRTPLAWADNVTITPADAMIEPSDTPPWLSEADWSDAPPIRWQDYADDSRGA